MTIATVTVTVPSSGEGPTANLSSLVGAKTVVLSGTFEGSYTLLASHDNATFVPVLLFDSDGVESIAQTLPDAYLSVRLRCNSNTLQSSTVTCEVSGLSAPGENHFTTLATFPAGSGGAGPVIDTYALFPPTGLEEDVNVLCAGGVTGVVVVEGSLDGSKYNVVGTFVGGYRQRPLLGFSPVLEFSPLSTPDKVRYLRTSVQGQVSSQVVLTLGGRIPSSASTGKSLVTAVCEDAGRVSIATDSSSPEDVLYEDCVDLSDLSLGASLTVQLNSIIKTLESGATATYRVYVGSTTPGDTTGGTVRATTNTSSNVEVIDSVIGAAFANPGGQCLVQVTGQVTAPGVGNPPNQAFIRGVTVVYG